MVTKNIRDHLNTETDTDADHKRFTLTFSIVDHEMISFLWSEICSLQVYSSNTVYIITWQFNGDDSRFCLKHFKQLPEWEYYFVFFRRDARYYFSRCFGWFLWIDRRYTIELNTATCTAIVNQTAANSITFCKFKVYKIMCNCKNLKENLKAL